MSRLCGYEGADPLVEETPRDLVEAKGKRVLAKRQRRVDQLQELYNAWRADTSRRAGISEGQFQAGRSFQRDCELAELRARSSGDFLPQGGVSWFDIPDGKLKAMDSRSKARLRLVRAFGYLGPDALAFALLVLLQRYSATAAAERVGWSRHNGLPALRLILDVFARIYVDSRGIDCSE